MLVKYIRNGVKFVGCVVATGAGKVGWSVCNPKDNFDKELAKTIAVVRSKVGTHIPENMEFPKRKVFQVYNMDNDVIDFDMASLSDVMKNEIAIMEKRSIRYFK